MYDKPYTASIVLKLRIVQTLFGGQSVAVHCVWPQSGKKRVYERVGVIHGGLDWIRHKLRKPQMVS
jgi:hypothetical protein